MTRTHLISIALCILFIIAGVFTMKGLASLKKEPPRQQPADLDVVPVRVQPLPPTTDRLSIKGFGTVQPLVTVALPSEVAGKITFRAAECEAGNLVASGQLLFRIDREPFELARSKAQAQINLLRAQEAQLEEEIRGFRRNLEISSQSVILAQNEFKRFSRLVEESATSKSQAEKAQSALQAALAGKIRDENNLTQGNARRAALKASLEQAFATLADAELQLRRTEIHAPFAGRVEKRFVESGEYVGVGKTLVELYDPATMEVRVPIALGDLPWLFLHAVSPSVPALDRETPATTSVTLEEQTEVTLCLPGRNEGTCCWIGRIARVAPSLADKTRTLEIVVAVSPRYSTGSTLFLPLLRGMFVEVSLQGRPLNNVYKVARALISRDDTIPLFQDGKLALRKVEVLRLDGDDAYIRVQLAGNEQLVITPIARAVEGMRLSIQAPEKP